MPLTHPSLSTCPPTRCIMYPCQGTTFTQVGVFCQMFTGSFTQGLHFKAFPPWQAPQSGSELCVCQHDDRQYLIKDCIPPDMLNGWGHMWGPFIEKRCGGYPAVFVKWYHLSLDNLTSYQNLLAPPSPEMLCLCDAPYIHRLLKLPE